MRANEKVCVARKQFFGMCEESTRERWRKAWRAARKFGRNIETSAEAETFGAIFLEAWHCLLYREYFSGDAK